MALDRFVIKLLIICLNVPIGEPSKSQKKKMYDPRGDLEVLENIDDDLYEQLMQELPVLGQVLTGDRKKKTLRFNESALGRILAPPTTTFQPFRFFHRKRREDEVVTTNVTTTHYAKYRTVNTWIPAWYYPDYRKKCQQLISCYACGQNESSLPSSSVCHDMFDSDNGQARALARFFRARCFYYDYYQYYDRITMTIWYFPPFFWYYTDDGMRMNYFGPYMDACHKRFVDVGPLYTIRGCRGRFHPWRAYEPSFADHRLARLEWMARGHDDVCVHSPHASLTPFSRAVSLFVRYHVCVCNTPYCNRSPTTATTLHAALLVVLVVDQMSVYKIKLF